MKRLNPKTGLPFKRGDLREDGRVFKGYKTTKTKHDGYYIENNILYLCSYFDKQIKFPYKYNLKQAIEFVWGWLENQKPDYNEPDTDGSTEQAWLIDTTNCDWHDGKDGTQVSFKKIWFIYGK